MAATSRSRFDARAWLALLSLCAGASVYGMIALGRSRVMPLNAVEVALALQPALALASAVVGFFTRPTRPRRWLSISLCIAAALFSVWMLHVSFGAGDAAAAGR